jgi:LSU ribosomal protein L4P
MQLSLHGNKGEIEVADGVFGVEYNEPLVHQVLVAYMAGARSGTKAQKSKGEVSGGGKKPWKQKGTGRARAGSIRSPLWRGGGVTFAAKPRDFSQKVNRKMYRGAVRSILSELLRRGDLLVADAIAIEEAKTRALLGQLSGLGLGDVLIVTEEMDRKLFLSARNLHKVQVCDVEALNPLALLSRKKVLMTAPAVKKIEAWLS